MKNVFLFSGLWIMVCYPLKGQDVKPFFHHITVEDGLLEARNDFIFKDSYGFVWISSVNGLNRYDGKEIKTYQQNFNDQHSLFGQNIQSPFFELGNGDVVFTTYEGINIYRRKTDRFEHFVVPDSLNFYYGFHLDPNGLLWFINDDAYLYSFDVKNSNFNKIDSLPTNALRVSPMIDGEGYIKELWAYSYQSPGIDVFKKNGNKFEIGEKFGSEITSSTKCNEILFEKNGEVWLATDLGLFLYNTETHYLSKHFPQDKNGSQINAISFFGNDTLLVAIENSGLFFFDRKKKKYLSQVKADNNNPHSLSTDNINKIYVDKNDGIWLSLTGIGVDFFYPDKIKFNYFKINNQKEESTIEATPILSGIIEDGNENIWCATMSSGIYVLNKEKKLIKHFVSDLINSPNLPSNEIISLFKDRQYRVWALTWEGVGVWDQEGQYHTVKTDSLDFLRMVQLSDGRLLLSCFSGGVYEAIENKENEFQVKPIPEVSANNIFVSLWQSNEGLLFACRDVSDIWVFDPNNGFKIMDKIPVTGESEFFYESPINGSIWIANSYGLVNINNKSGRWEPHFFNEKEGLSGRAVYGILPDGDSILWLSTNRGLATIRTDNFQVKRYGIADGLPSLTNNTLAYLKTNNGEMLFGTSGGVVNFFPNMINPYGVKARPVITQILINDEENPQLVKGSDGAVNVNVIRNLKLPFDYNTISFYFAALEYSDPKNVNFKYKMEGVDNDWVESGSQNFARYSKIGVGEFEFKLMASNSDGEWSTPISLAISITPPFTQTPLFYLLAIALIVGVIWLYFNNRRKRQDEIHRLEVEKREALEQERQRIARDVHDDLGSGLSALSLQTAIAQYRTTPEEVRLELEKIDQTARDLSGKIKEVIWTVSSQNDTLVNLISYLNQYAVDLLDNTDIDLSVNLPEAIPEITLTGEYRRMTFLAFKEALNNVTKHAQATQIDINFKTDSDSLRVEVSDNGIGFDPQLLLASTGNGLLNMQTRMKDIGGDCIFKTSQKGSTITFVVALNPD